jgi:hypothetical protein
MSGRRTLEIFSVVPPSHSHRHGCVMNPMLLAKLIVVQALPRRVVADRASEDGVRRRLSVLIFPPHQELPIAEQLSSELASDYPIPIVCFRNVNESDKLGQKLGVGRAHEDRGPSFYRMAAKKLHAPMGNVMNLSGPSRPIFASRDLTTDGQSHGIAHPVAAVFPQRPREHICFRGRLRHSVPKGTRCMLVIKKRKPILTVTHCRLCKMRVCREAYEISEFSSNACLNQPEGLTYARILP